MKFCILNDSSLLEHVFNETNRELRCIYFRVPERWKCMLESFDILELSVCDNHSHDFTFDRNERGNVWKRIVRSKHIVFWNTTSTVDKKNLFSILVRGHIFKSFVVPSDSDNTSISLRENRNRKRLNDRENTR